jgi:hypothetical protein
MRSSGVRQCQAPLGGGQHSSALPSAAPQELLWLGDIRSSTGRRR